MLDKRSLNAFNAYDRPHADLREFVARVEAAGELIRSRIPGASLTILDAAHISNVEQAHAFTDAVIGFLTQR